MTSPTSYGYGRGAYGTLNYGSDTATSGHNVALVLGTAQVLPRIRIDGACVSPQLVFNTIGTTLYLKGLKILSGDYLLIDVASRQILVNGDITNSAYSSLSLSAADGWNGWPYLIEGSNVIDAFFASRDTNCKVTLTWRDSWI